MGLDKRTFGFAYIPHDHTNTWCRRTSMCTFFQYHSSADVYEISHTLDIRAWDSCSPVSHTFGQWWVVVLVINAAILIPNATLYIDQWPTSICCLPMAFIQLLSLLLTSWTCIETAWFLVAFKDNIYSWRFPIRHVNLAIVVCEPVTWFNGYILCTFCKSNYKINSGKITNLKCKQQQNTCNHVIWILF